MNIKRITIDSLTVSCQNGFKRFESVLDECTLSTFVGGDYVISIVKVDGYTTLCSVSNVVTGDTFTGHYAKIEED